MTPSPLQCGHHIWKLPYKESVLEPDPRTMVVRRSSLTGEKYISDIFATSLADDTFHCFESRQEG